MAGAHHLAVVLLKRVYVNDKGIWSFLLIQTVNPNPEPNQILGHALYIANWSASSQLGFLTMLVARLN